MFPMLLILNIDWHGILWTINNVTDAQMLLFFYFRWVTRLHSPTRLKQVYQINGKYMKNTFPMPKRQALLHPPLQVCKCSSITFREVSFLTKKYHMEMFCTTKKTSERNERNINLIKFMLLLSQTKKHKKEMKEI